MTGLAISLHSSNEPSKLSLWTCDDESNINISIIIIIIIDVTEEADDLATSLPVLWHQRHCEHHSAPSQRQSDEATQRSLNQPTAC